MPFPIPHHVVGQRFGKLTAISIGPVINYHRSIDVKCDCGNSTRVLHTNLKRGMTTSCGCTHVSGKTNTRWKGVGELSGSFWALITKGARTRSIPMELTIQQAWDQFERQEGRCAFTGVKLVFPRHCRDHTQNASLDRIDSALPYRPGNVQWVVKQINMMKRGYRQDEFIALCRAVAAMHTSTPIPSDMDWTMVSCPHTPAKDKLASAA